MIQFEQVTKRYPGSNEALKNVSLSIQAGELVFVTGHSGAGKSTLLKLIAAIEHPTSGTSTNRQSKYQQTQNFSDSLYAP